ncbi:MAG: 7-carboxy-7-deazaguanine synthase QueE [SAR86 cluster bacterium]|uniref:7-carboxy-7-deazaguanine synthase n=1 Tax=SAR86 cluster bacterium TaxID=2030880 RepID=A0A2A4MUD4_9GAMM|nr:MAG: 7-carboxy-7-deazaguanine synthase QueE [SAR86 cluster bacterium]
MNSSALRITEIFHSLQGETRTAGIPTVFVRLTGCPLRCQYCDTAYAFSGGEMLSVDAIMEQVQGYNCHYITVTGGEPLAQPQCRELLTSLADKGYEISLETSGALSIEGLDTRISVILDLKTPGSLECDRNLESNIALLKTKDQLKFVICDRRDYDWAKAKVDQYDLQSRVSEILFSPSFEQLPAKHLAQWILDDGLNVRMQLQMHKSIWGDDPGH